MTSPSSSHAERTGAMSSKQPATPKLQVQRSLSTETITIHFSAFGKEEEEEEEELYRDSSPEELSDQSVVTALEAKEELQFEHDPTTSASVAVLPVASSTLFSSSAAAVPSHVISSASLASSSWPSEHKIVTADATASTLSSSSSPSKSAALPFATPVSTLPSTKPFMSLVKSLTSDVEHKETSLRHRHLMKTLVKSLSTDTYRSDTDSVSYRSPDSRLNLHLFKQFTQTRSTGGDSKTAPSSPLTSPLDGRSSFFKVTEVEARIEDTKRRLSEVIYEPFQLLSKMMGDESGSSSSYRPKALSSSASELSNLASFNGLLESNNNYSIKEEECDSEGECGGTKKVRIPSSLMEKCSLSALASKEEEEFCELYSEDFDLDFKTESDGLKTEASSAVARKEGSTDVCREDEPDVDDEPLPSIPLKTLLALVALVYAYFVLPLPTYVSGLLLGAAVGFTITVGVVWLVAPRSSAHLRKRRGHQWNTAHLDIKEPGIFKGWMNEISSYDPETYHATLTHSVYVRLEGSTLRLSKPNKNISRRASFNEPKPDVTYISQKIYDLTASKIHLVPLSLARKRVWNKKYPICIELGKQDDFMSKAEAGGDREGEEERVEAGGEELKQPLLSQEGGQPAQPPSHRDPTLYLFGRTGREKEEWFHRILLASRLKLDAKKASSLPGNKPGKESSSSSFQSGALTHSRSSSKGSVEDVMSPPKQKELAASVRQKMLLDYNVFMAKYIPLESSNSPAQSPAHSTDSSPSTASKVPAPCAPARRNPLVEEPETWVNALLGRIFWDFLREKYWSDIVSKKIQMKLSKIRLPYFMNELTLTELDMGVAVPKILQASKPSIDHQGEWCSGLWIDLEISYNGSFLMTLETKMNLTRLGKDPVGEGLGRVGEIGKEGVRPRTYCLADSDEESSSAGSSDEEDPPDLTAGDKALALGAEGFVGGHRASKIMRFVDKITKSKYFQKATETEFIKKKIEEVSNTPLLLTVEVQECRGTLAVNIPPPPTDRIWYGFRSPPHLELKARPKLGEREVTFAHVTDWIENKLEREFQ
ncbi:TEX2 protein, partial [Polyodon spathula]|nr:TEX2 protein [Polyodon spathula]